METPTLIDATRRFTTNSRSTAHRLASQSVALVLAGGRGSRLAGLTDRRAKPAVPFGGMSMITHIEPIHDRLIEATVGSV